MLFLMLAGNSSDCIVPPGLLEVDDVLLTAWTSRIVFWPDEPLLMVRPESTRLALDDDTARLLELLLGNCLLTDEDEGADDDDDTETIEQQYYTGGAASPIHLHLQQNYDTKANQSGLLQLPIPMRD